MLDLVLQSLDLVFEVSLVQSKLVRLPLVLDLLLLQLNLYILKSEFLLLKLLSQLLNRLSMLTYLLLEVITQLRIFWRLLWLGLSDGTDHGLTRADVDPMLQLTHLEFQQLHLLLET